MKSKVLKGLSKAFLEDNPVSDGGLSAHIIKKRFNPLGVAAATGAVGMVGLADEGIKGRNQMLMGRVSYSNGPARMTNSYGSGVTQAMYRVSGGNREIFSDMAQEVVSGNSLGGKIETYGATPELISALYNMGGR